MAAAPAMAMAQDCSMNDDLEARLAALSNDFSPAQKAKSAAPLQDLNKADSSPPPSFEALLSWQSSSGAWASSNLSKMAGFTLYGSTVDSAFKAQYPGLSEELYSTLLALYILEEIFPHRAGESGLIVRKAKKFLQAQGVDKVNNYLKHFTLALKK